MEAVKELVSREAYEKLLEFNELLLKWNKAINLISPGTVNDIMVRHVLDSIQLLPYIEENSSIIDLGSGAGFPSIILSIVGLKDVTLIESDARKCTFLLQASKLSSGKIQVINDRIENLEGFSCDIITSRAFASLDKIFEFSSKIKVRNKYLLHKGAGYKSEIRGARKHWLFNEIVHDKCFLL